MKLKQELSWSIFFVWLLACALIRMGVFQLDIPAYLKSVFIIEIIPFMALFNAFRKTTLDKGQIEIRELGMKTEIPLSRIRSVRLEKTDLMRRILLCMPAYHTKVDYNRFDQIYLWGSFDELILDSMERRNNITEGVSSHLRY